ncbi:hypothetical protein F4775DRAFT_167325 [Biscogniauxia sp. FL1348]|nr:hypothetical protein F4775DRAFT_167325 [Biscogniauxia sp. FL1348]
MHPRQFLLSSLALATGVIPLALALPDPLTTSPPPAQRGTLSSSSSSSSSPTCLLIAFPLPPTNPPPCWSWFARTSTPSTYCSLSSLSLSSLSLPTSTSTSVSTTWLSSCEAAAALVSNSSYNRDFFLASYSRDVFNTLLRVTVPGSGNGVGCALQLRPARAPSDEQIYVGGADVAGILGSAVGVAAGSGSSNGVEGSMMCGEDEVSWRVVPVDS